MASVSKSSVFFLLSYLVLFCSAKDDNKKCPESDCGRLGKLHYPFSNTSNPDCGLFIKDCDTSAPKIQLVVGGSERSYDVAFLGLNYVAIKYRLDPDKCESLTNLSLPSFPYFSLEISSPIRTLYKCKRNRNVHDISRPRESFKNLSCNEYEIWYSPSQDRLSDAFNCSIIQLPIGDDVDWLKTFEFVLQVSWSEYCFECLRGGGYCRHHNGSVHCVKGKEKRKWVIPLAISFIGIGVLTMAVIIYCSRRKFSYFWKKESVSHQNIEDFLRSFGPLAIRRYSYSDIKKMTNFFEEKLGQGGYGGVYKGKLQDGHLVAVKVLKESRENGEEFINEVASISRTSHVNIVTLMGFCFEGSKRALVYELMLNGSLEKFIYKEYSSKADHQLEWKTLYKIAVGIARGLEYLHKGCNARILHFDIKPHNILLDKNYHPKISDFGLAKICSRDESIISMMGTRGTIGYIAPEVFCRNFGGISHKSDVYSYGMMILEMVGVKNNINIDGDRTSEIYFPHWVYRRLELDEELSLQGLVMNEEDGESAKKMIIVGLWCIQTDPSNRPAMDRVVDMLEGSSEHLQIPPKPFLSSPSRSHQTRLPFDYSTTMDVLQVEST